MAQCPQCKKEFKDKGPFFPFCCERCKLLDLGKWAAEEYKVEAQDEEDQSSDADSNTKL